MITVTCSRCGGTITARAGYPVNLTCQRCGSQSVQFSGEGDASGIVYLFRCLECKRTIPFRTREEQNIRHDCGSALYAYQNQVPISSIRTGIFEVTDDLSLEQPSSLPEADLAPIPEPANSRIKIVIPYFQGGPLVERAARSWYREEVVFATTDPGVFPPFGDWFFSRKNATEIPNVGKTKPFLNTILRATMRRYPDNDYYGFFNSDIILPPGKHIPDLLPRFGRKAVMFHRLDVIGSEDAPPFRLGVKGQVYAGKDGFIANKEVTRKIIREFPNTIIGAPCWDSALTFWLFEELGEENVDIRFGDVWHVLHPQRWSYADPDAAYNAKLFRRAERERCEFDWRKFKEKRNNQDKKRKQPALRTRIGIIQPGRLGDILITLPIAKYYFDLGYEIYWPVPSGEADLFRYAPYVHPLVIKHPGSHLYKESLRLLRENKCKILDLAIGFGRNESDWISSGLSFDAWKYQAAGVPLEEKYKLNLLRDYGRERLLLKNIAPPKDYAITHSKKSAFSPYKFNTGRLPAVEIRAEKGFTVVDWLSVIEGAKQIYCVDSCIANLVNQLGIGIGKRWFYPWPVYDARRPRRDRLHVPRMAEDWKFLGPDPLDSERYTRK